MSVVPLEAHLRVVHDALAGAGLLARRSLGQHFLLDARLLRRIVVAAGPLEGRDVLEVGPGPGSLTAALLEVGARVTAFEIDSDWAEFTARTLAGSALEIVRHDVRAEGGRLLTDTVAALDRSSGRPPIVVSNLPYQVASPVIVDLARASPAPERIVVTVQAEVARRLTAGPGNRERGLLTLLVGTAARSRPLFDLRPGSFRPPPRVSSTVVEIVPDEQRRRRSATLAPLDDLLRAAFSGRRKMLRRSLAAWLGPAIVAGVAPGLLEQRPEQLDLEQWWQLAEAVARRGGSPPAQ